MFFILNFLFWLIYYFFKSLLLPFSSPFPVLLFSLFLNSFLPACLFPFSISSFFPLLLSSLLFSLYFHAPSLLVSFILCHPPLPRGTCVAETQRVAGQDVRWGSRNWERKCYLEASVSLVTKKARR